MIKVGENLNGLGISPFSTGWNFHSRLGWFWSISQNDNDVWVYFNHLGWLCCCSIFPYMYSYNEKNWYYVDLANADQTRWFIFDFKTSNSGKPLIYSSILEVMFVSLITLIKKRELLWQFLLRNVKSRHRGSLLGSFG